MPTPVVDLSDAYDPRLIDPRGLQNHQTKVENHLAQIAKNTTPKKSAPGQRA